MVLMTASQKGKNVCKEFIITLGRKEAEKKDGPDVDEQ
jgi:hypothetical protein